jgi:hypothetical protein
MAPRSTALRLRRLELGRQVMQLECSDESAARSIGLQSTPAVVLAAAEGREILSAVATSVAVEDSGVACSVRIIGGVRERHLRRVSVSARAWLDGQVQLRSQPLTFPDHAPDPTGRRSGLDYVASVVEGTGRNGLRTTRRRADREAGIANT